MTINDAPVTLIIATPIGVAPLIALISTCGIKAIGGPPPISWAINMRMRNSLPIKVMTRSRGYSSIVRLATKASGYLMSLLAISDVV